MACFIIKSFEGKWAFIEHDRGTIFSIPRSLLAEDAREDDVLNENLKIHREEAGKRQKKLRTTIDDVKRKTRKDI